MRRPARPCSRNASADAYSLTRTPIERTSDSSDSLIANSSSMMQTVLSCTGCLAWRHARWQGRERNRISDSVPTAPASAIMPRYGVVDTDRTRSRVTIRPRWRTGPVRLPRHGSSCPSCTERCGRAPRPIHAIARLDRRTGQHAARRRSRGHAMPQFAEMPEPRVAPAHADSRIRQNLDDPDPRSRRRGGLACAVITLAAHARRQPVAPGMSSRAPAVLDGSSRRISARSNTSSSANVGCIISTVPLALNALVPLAQSTRCTDESRTSPLRDRPRRALHSRWNRVWGTAFRDPSDRGRCFPIPKSDRRGDMRPRSRQATHDRSVL